MALGAITGRPSDLAQLTHPFECIRHRCTRDARCSRDRKRSSRAASVFLFVMGDVDLSLLDGFLDPLDGLMPHPSSAPTSQPLLNSSTAPTLDRSSWPGSSSLSEAPSASALPNWESGYGVLQQKDKGKEMLGAAGRPTSFQSLLHHSTPSLESQGSMHKDHSKSLPISGLPRQFQSTASSCSSVQ